MYVMLVFDTEDVYYRSECGIDSIPGWLAEIMTDVGVTGTFFVMGEKVRSMLERGRKDVFRKMLKHDLASHQQGNRHPLIPEVLEGKSWDDGVAAMRKYEDWVTEAFVEAFRREPVGFSRHNCYFGPQHLAVAGERGLPYAYQVASIPDSRQPMLYAGALTFAEHMFAGFDCIYSRDDVFEARLKDLDRHITKRLEENWEWQFVFACHPVRVMSRGWFEHYALATGNTRTTQDLGWEYGLKPRAEEARAQANFRRLCQYLKQHPDLQVVGISEAARLFGAQATDITRDVLTHYAIEMAQKEVPLLHSTFSPAELACGLAESLLHLRDDGGLPEAVRRRNVLGPKERPVLAVEKDLVTGDELTGLCRQMVEGVKKDGALPANLAAGGARVGISQFALLAARAYQAAARREEYARLQVIESPRYPEIAWEFDRWIQRYIGEHWGMPLDFSCDRMAEHARLQTWTIKPAWQRLPQGPVCDGPKYGPRRPVRSPQASARPAARRGQARKA